VSEGYVRTEDGLRLYVRVVGEGEPAVLVPGACYSEEDLLPLAAGRRLVFYDQRCRGRSDAVDDPARMGIELEARDLEAVRAHVGLERVSLLGWSYNGLVVALYAAAHPGRVERQVLLCAVPPGPGPYPGQKTPEELDARVDPAGLAGLEEMRGAGLPERDPTAYCRAFWRVHRARQTTIPAALERTRGDPCRWPNEWPEHRQARGRHVFGALRDADWRPRVRAAAAPTLVVHGTEDAIPLAASQEWVATLPDARLLVIEGSGHFPPLERPDVFFPAVDEFLAGERA
jgi:proline iminopeptidase